MNAGLQYEVQLPPVLCVLTVLQLSPFVHNICDVVTVMLLSALEGKY